jgi:transmembrane sensor
MSKLPTPFEPWLDEPLPEVDVQRIWRELHTPQPAPWYAQRHLQLSAAGVMLLCALALGAWMQREPAPLALRDAGSLTRSLVLGGDAASAFQLTDGSQIALGGASRLEVVENSATRFALKLERGRVQFDVQPGGPRRWSIACGEVRVEVVGTSFVVDQSTRGVGVEVKHGVVVVRGAGVEHGERRLSAGERLYIERRPLAPPPTAASAPAPAARPLPENAGPRDAASGHATLDHRPEAHPSAPRASLSSLLREADAARQRGDDARAASLLERVRATAPGSVHAALASWTLARMRMQREPSLAAADIASALQADLPSGLREAARARLVEAYARAGQDARARAAAEAYRGSYRQGRYQREIERWTHSP